MKNKKPLYLLLTIMCIGYALEWLYTEPTGSELLNPLAVSQVHAQEVVQPIVVPPKSEKEQIQDYIRSKFGKDSDKMIKIIGTCENGKWNQKATNTNRNGTKDWGIAQINDANSKLCRGLDFRNSWKDNIDCAYRVYQSQGLSAWSCSYTVGIDPFYMRSK